jgi:preprotein translocase subunit SecE
MADKKKKPNIFKRIAQKFKDVRQELKRVIWPTKEKLIQNSAVVLVVIIVCTIFLTAIGKGAGWILEKVGFYDQAVETTVADTSDTVPSDGSDASASESAPAESSSDASASDSTEASASEETTPSES